MKKFILLFLVLITNAALGQTTLWCEGYANGKNLKQGQYQSPASTTVEFSENSDLLSINDSSKLQVGAIYPFNEVKIFNDVIFFKTTIDPIFGKGSFRGSINRITGEMNTSLFIISTMGDIITVDGKLMCNKRVGNKF
jgi:hypothetical protein